MGKKEILLLPEAIKYPFILTIDPRKLINKGKLYTTQTFIDQEKLIRALNGDVDDKYPIPKGYWWEERNAIVLGDGNHRTAVAYIRDKLIQVEIVGPFDGSKKPISFNVFIRKYISGMGLEY